MFSPIIIFSFIPYLIASAWLFVLIYGVVMLVRKRIKKGIAMITLFCAPLVLLAFLMSYMNYDKIDCYLHAADQSKCTVENNWKY